MVLPGSRLESLLINQRCPGPHIDNRQSDPAGSSHSARWTVLFLVLLLINTANSADVVPKKAQTQNKEIQVIPKPKISIYYEMLCPPSVTFLGTSLARSILEKKGLHELVDIDLIPFGNGFTVKYFKDVIPNCQHGEEECRVGFADLLGQQVEHLCHRTAA